MDGIFKNKMSMIAITDHLKMAAYRSVRVISTHRQITCTLLEKWRIQGLVGTAEGKGPLGRTTRR